MKKIMSVGMDPENVETLNCLYNSYKLKNAVVKMLVDKHVAPLVHDKNYVGAVACSLRSGLGSLPDVLLKIMAVCADLEIQLRFKGVKRVLNTLFKCFRPDDCIYYVSSDGVVIGLEADSYTAIGLSTGSIVTKLRQRLNLLALYHCYHRLDEEQRSLYLDERRESMTGKSLLTGLSAEHEDQENTGFNDGFAKADCSQLALSLDVDAVYGIVPVISLEYVFKRSVALSLNLSGQQFRSCTAGARIYSNADSYITVDGRCESVKSASHVLFGTVSVGENGRNLMNIWIVFEEDRNDYGPSRLYQQLEAWFYGLNSSCPAASDNIAFDHTKQTAYGIINAESMSAWAGFFVDQQAYFGSLFFYVEIFGTKEVLCTNFSFSSLSWNLTVDNIMTKLLQYIDLQDSSFIKVDLCVGVVVAGDNVCWPSASIKAQCPSPVTTYQPLFCSNMKNYHCNLIGTPSEHQVFRCNTGISRINFYAKYVEYIKKVVGDMFPPVKFLSALSSTLMHSKTDCDKIINSLAEISSLVTNVKRSRHVYRLEVTTRPFLIWVTISNLLDLVFRTDWYYLPYDVVQSYVNSGIGWFCGTMQSAVLDNKYFDLLFTECILREVFVHGKTSVSLSLPKNVRKQIQNLVTPTIGLMPIDALENISSQIPVTEKLASCIEMAEKLSLFGSVDTLREYNKACTVSLLHAEYATMQEACLAVVNQYVLDIHHFVGSELTSYCGMFIADNLSVEQRRALVATKSFTSFRTFFEGLRRLSKKLYCNTLMDHIANRFELTAEELLSNMQKGYISRGYNLGFNNKLLSKPKPANRALQAQQLVALIDDGVAQTLSELEAFKKEVVGYLTLLSPTEYNLANPFYGHRVYGDTFDMLIVKGWMIHGNMKAISTDYCLGLVLVADYKTIYNRYKFLHRLNKVEHLRLVTDEARVFDVSSWSWANRLDFWTSNFYQPGENAAVLIKKLIGIDIQLWKYREMTKQNGLQLIVIPKIALCPDESQALLSRIDKYIELPTSDDPRNTVVSPFEFATSEIECSLSTRRLANSIPVIRNDNNRRENRVVKPSLHTGKCHARSSSDDDSKDQSTLSSSSVEIPSHSDDGCVHVIKDPTKAWRSRCAALQVTAKAGRSPNLTQPHPVVLIHDHSHNSALKQITADGPSMVLETRQLNNTTNLFIPLAVKDEGNKSWMMAPPFGATKLLADDSVQNLNHASSELPSCNALEEAGNAQKIWVPKLHSQNFRTNFFGNDILPKVCELEWSIDINSDAVSSFSNVEKAQIKIACGEITMPEMTPMGSKDHHGPSASLNIITSDANMQQDERRKVLETKMVSFFLKHSDGSWLTRSAIGHAIFHRKFRASVEDVLIVLGFLLAKNVIISKSELVNGRSYIKYRLAVSIKECAEAPHIVVDSPVSIEVTNSEICIDVQEHHRNAETFEDSVDEFYKRVSKALKKKNIHLHFTIRDARNVLAYATRPTVEETKFMFKKLVTDRKIIELASDNSSVANKDVDNIKLESKYFSLGDES